MHSVTLLGINVARFVGKLLLINLLSVTLASSVVASTLIPKLQGISAKAYLLIDYASQMVLAEKNADQPLAPASMTKVMTAYVALKERQNGQIADTIKISRKAYRMQGSRTFLEINSEVPFNTVLRGLMVQSGNDAAVAIAEHISGSEDAFTQRMNEYAEQMGLRNTNFTNSSGWPDDNHYSSARDLAIIASHFIRDFPEFYRIYSLKSFTYNDIKQNNRNRLLFRDKFVDGIKTGHTNSAGYCLMASAKKDGMRLISVVIGTLSDNQRTLQSQKILNYGFRYYLSKTMALATKPLQTSQVWYGNQDIVNIGVDKDWKVVLPRRFASKATINYNYPRHNLEAPIAQGQILGKAELSINNQLISQVDLISFDTVQEAGLFSQLADWISRLSISLKSWLFGG